MRQENATSLLETRVQKLLLDYIRCWEQYCRILRLKHTPPPSVEQLDRFIVILQTFRTLLQAITEEPGSPLLHTPHLEKRKTPLKTEQCDQPEESP